MVKSTESKGKSIAISGITGLVGKYVGVYFEQKGFEVLALTRDKFSLPDVEFAEFLEGVDYIVNLAGESVTKPWTEKHKEAILSSRILTTQKIARAIPLMNKKPSKVINASAIGIYDYLHVHTEESTHFGDNFLADVVKKWEVAADEIKAAGVKLFKCRIGVVMSEKGGALGEYLRLIKFGITLRFGNGNQNISFVHIHDLARSFKFILSNCEIDGVYNIVAPENSTNRLFALQLKRIYPRVIVLAIPKFIVRMMKGEMSTIVVNGEKVLPARLEKEGFDFTFPNLENVLFYLLV